MPYYKYNFFCGITFLTLSYKAYKKEEITVLCRFYRTYLHFTDIILLALKTISYKYVLLIIS